MKPLVLKLTQIGNSRGIRLPADVIQRYKLDKTVIVEQRPNELAIRSSNQKKLTWKETYKQMAAAKEDWSEFDVTAADDLE
jgi:antitoxin component of MazEF toxin-antitoxin module